MAQQSSRLHRLLTLLDTGSTQATRFAAAKQIGNIAKLHPLELNSLIKKVSQYLRSKNWDTRVAAAHAIGAIAENVKHTTFKELFSFVEAEALEVGIPDADKEVVTAWSSFYSGTAAGLCFSSFDINKVLEFGSPLLASGGQEYDIVTDNGKDPAERLARQKQNLHRRLGLDICEQFMDVNEVIRDEDLIIQKVPRGNGINRACYASVSGQNIQQLVANMVPSYRPKRLSARELNLLKRKAKNSAKDNKGLSEDDESESLHPQTAMPDVCGPPTGSNKFSVDGTMEDSSSEDNVNGHWPFSQFVEQLTHDIFDPVWEIRHGAMMALREILTRHGASAGVLMADLNSDLSWLDNNFGTVNPKKRARAIDLNTQFVVDEHAPEPKIIKLEHEQLPFSSGTFSSEAVNFNFVPQRELFNASHNSSVINNLDQSIGDVKVESVLVNGCDTKAKQENDSSKPKTFFTEDVGSSKLDYFTNLPENCKLSKLIKLARHSWIRNWEFLQDCSIRFLCVLSLDRFGDFVSDQVVAPVRETCAQALGAILKYMHPLMVNEILNVLLRMQCRQEWEVRHGSLLGVKYLVAVRQDLLQDLLVRLLPACKAGLEDRDDDVRAVAAEALIPAATALATLEGCTLRSIVMLLWDILLDLDDLSPSTSSVMNLLAEIYSQPKIVPKMLESVVKHEFDLNRESQEVNRNEENPYILSSLTPRLWPFMRHNITSVRHSAIRTLERLLEVCYQNASASFSCTASILGDTLRIVFQNFLLESDEDILLCTERVWRLLVQCPRDDLDGAAKSFFSSWLQLATTPIGSTLDASKMFFPAALPRKSHFRAAAKMRAVKLEHDFHGNFPVASAEGNILQPKNDDFSASSLKIIVGAGDKSVTRTRVDTATALGFLASKLTEASLQVVIGPVFNDLRSSSGFQRQVASIVLIAWFKELKSSASSKMLSVNAIVDPLRQCLLGLLMCSDPALPTKDSPHPYNELSRTYNKMRKEASVLYQMAKTSSLYENIFSEFNLDMETLAVNAAIDLASKISLPVGHANGKASSEKYVLSDVESSKQQLLSTSGYLKCLQANLHVTVTALVAAAVVWMSELPPKLNPIILPLMAAVKKEKEEILQEKAAEALAELISNCIGRKPSPNDKLIKNLCTLTCTDPSQTPQVALISSVEVIEEHNLLSNVDSVTNQKARLQMASSEDRSRHEGFISRRGAEFALRQLSKKFGPSLFDKLPKLWDCLTEIIRPISFEGQTAMDYGEMTVVIDGCKDPQALINNIQVVCSITSIVDAALVPKMLAVLPCLFCCVRDNRVAVRLSASRCITSMAMTMTTEVMRSVIEKGIPMLGDTSSVSARQGAGMLLSLLVQALGVELVPYAPLLVVPLLRCMGDSDNNVRQSVTHSFAALVPLLPLSREISPPVELSECISKNSEDAKFLEQLLDNSHIDDYKLAINLKVELRRYQQEGINWLSFLRRFKLHGILCDDMGLGKTLQASAMVASDIAERHGNGSGEEVPSLIICPSTLVGHWAYEIEKYIDDSVMIMLQYIGSAQERLLLRKTFIKYNVIITSYDVVRKDIDYLGKLSWNYCILDEGHIIKNSKSKITGAVKQLKAEHRLILSGTPIQNNVLELWSLFDFLMPGFLGTERQFQANYGKPLLAAKDSKCSAKDAEAGVLAMEALHKQVMPFLLRRTKDEVLSDLPEKIIQDRYCELSPVQLKLYEQFSSSEAKKEISDLVKENEAPNVPEASPPAAATSHVFQALQYLLKLCSHPLLVLGEKPPASIMRHLAEAGIGSSNISRELHELRHSPKLVALREILEECGIGADASSPDGVVVGEHRVLVFVQHRALLDIIEKDLFQIHMKSVSYLRLDGSVETEKRFDIVKSFNSDPTIDVLLLTTHVGGLGLNLTSADTLVFMEHDWNPMKDLQAMDRAHRLGQRKVVNVHRLIMRGTMEEKVMGLQKFKVSVANAVINAENSSMKTMNTDQLLDLFTPAQKARKGDIVSSSSNTSVSEDPKLLPGGKGLKAMLNGLEELWDQSQYTEEYNLNHFLQKLNG